MVQGVEGLGTNPACSQSTGWCRVGRLKDPLLLSRVEPGVGLGMHQASLWTGALDSGWHLLTIDK